MIKSLVFIISFLSLVFSTNLSFEDIPIQEEGRIKPLDTFAKNQLLRMSAIFVRSLVKMARANFPVARVKDLTLLQNWQKFRDRNLKEYRCFLRLDFCKS